MQSGDCTRVVNFKIVPCCEYNFKILTHYIQNQANILMALFNLSP